MSSPDNLYQQGKARCETCTYYRPPACVYSPPTLHGWPETSADNVCGKYHPDRKTELETGRWHVVPQLGEMPRHG